MLSSNMAFSFSFSGISQYNSSDFSIISLISNCIASILASTFSDGSVLLASYNSYNSSKYILMDYTYALVATPAFP